MLQTKAEIMYPDGMPGLLSMKEFGKLLGVSRPTALKIARAHPEYTEKRGNTQMVAVGLYQRLSRDEHAKLADGVDAGPITRGGES